LRTFFTFNPGTPSSVSDNSGAMSDKLKKIARSSPLISSDVGTNVVQADFTFNCDGISYCELTDATRVQNYDKSLAGKSFNVVLGRGNDSLVKFKGDCLKIGVEWDPSNEYLKYRLANSSSWLNRSIVSGRKVKAHSGTMYLYDRNCTFNPSGRPNMDGRTNWTDPCFVAPEYESAEDGDHPWHAVHWNIMDMLGYCFANCEGGGGNVAVALSGGSTVMVNLKPSDISVSGNLLSALSTILDNCSQAYIIDPWTDKLSFVSTVYPGGGRDVVLPGSSKKVIPGMDGLEPAAFARNFMNSKEYGGKMNPSWASKYIYRSGSFSNKGQLEFDFGNNYISRVYGVGGNKRYEATILLQPGWNPDIEPEATSFFKSQDLGAVDISRMMNIYENTEFATYKNVGRKFVANDAGFWQLIYPNYAYGTYNWESAFDGSSWYDHRRPFMDRRLKKDPVTGEGLPPILEYRYTPAPVNCPGFPNTWKVYSGKWEFLKDEAGIYVHDPQPLWTPGYGFPQFRITTGIEADEALEPYVASASIVGKYDKMQWVTGLGQFQYEKITTSEHDEPTVLRDDSDRLWDYINEMEDRDQVCPLVSGSINIPYIDPGWKPGDWVAELAGTGIVVNSMVVSVRYECGQNGNYTTLSLGTLGGNS